MRVLNYVAKPPFHVHHGPILPTDTPAWTSRSRHARSRFFRQRIDIGKINSDCVSRRPTGNHQCLFSLSAKPRPAHRLLLYPHARDNAQETKVATESQRTPSSAMAMCSPSREMRSARSFRYRVLVAANVTVCRTGLFCMFENSPCLSTRSSEPSALQAAMV